MGFWYGNGLITDPNCVIKRFEGFNTSPNGKYWGTEPINNDGIFYSELEGMNRRERRKYTRERLKQKYGKKR